MGEREQRLYALTAWQETPFFNARERAALAWTDALTKIRQEVSDTLFTMARKTFSEKELVDLSLAIVAINSWNRLAIAFHKPAGSYRPDLALWGDGWLKVRLWQTQGDPDPLLEGEIYQGPR